ncbi:unnamed protein product [Xylocopa violacea]|uniref:Uncharacterized protein n=1 Tax=Xylocopa violacea TaxID=135666 RepID=A0ABP1N5D0_XYLVO
MEDPELIELKKLKEELAAKARDLIEKLKKQENCDDSVKLKMPECMKDVIIEDRDIRDQEKQLFYDITRKVTGISYENVDRKWLHDKIYKYTAKLITDVLNVNVELIVKIENEEEFEISDVTCHFINTNKCRMLEIEPWIQNYTKMKNFSLLTSAITEYNEKSTVRQKMLDSLKAKQCAYYEECQDKNGGFYVYLHSPKDIKCIHIKFQWSVLLLKRSLHMGHYFIIQTTKNGLKFVKKNKPLLQKFEKKNFTRQELYFLWSELCSAVDLYDNENQDKTLDSDDNGNEDKTFDLYDNGSQDEASINSDTCI